VASSIFKPTLGIPERSYYHVHIEANNIVDIEKTKTNVPWEIR
jgi:hypothetical protein